MIAASLSDRPIGVDTGSDFVHATCTYQEVLALEMRHLKTYPDHLPKVEVSARAALPAAANVYRASAKFAKVRYSYLSDRRSEASDRYPEQPATTLFCLDPGTRTCCADGG
jgi:hypothetical protein